MQPSGDSPTLCGSYPTWIRPDSVSRPLEQSIATRSPDSDAMARAPFWFRATIEVGRRPISSSSVTQAAARLISETVPEAWLAVTSHFSSERIATLTGERKQEENSDRIVVVDESVSAALALRQISEKEKAATRSVSRINASGIAVRSRPVEVRRK